LDYDIFSYLIIDDIHLTILTKEFVFFLFLDFVTFLYKIDQTLIFSSVENSDAM